MIYQVMAKVTGKNLLPGDYMKLSFEEGDIAKEAVPGQFLTIRTSRYDTPLLRRPFGIHDVENDVVSILVKIVGPGTEQLSKIEPDEMIDVLGPIGTGFEIPPKGTPIIMVAGGIGIAPMGLLSRKLAGRENVKLFFGGATGDDLPALDLFYKLGIETITATEDGSVGHKGFVTEPLLEALNSEAEILACGPPAMLAATAKIAREAGARCQVSLETVMACGVGSCLGCVREVVQSLDDETDEPCYERVCQEGPVFYSDKVHWKAEAAND